VPLARSAGQEVPPALQSQSTGAIEADGSIGAVDLLFNDQMPPLECVKGNGIEFFVFGLAA
jgi:hypothetical protein